MQVDGDPESEVAWCEKTGRSSLYKRTGTKLPSPIGLAIGAQLRQRTQHFCDQRDRAVQKELCKSAETRGNSEELTEPQRRSKFAYK